MTEGPTHQWRVEALLAEAAADHAALLMRVPETLRASLPVDGQGITRAIEHLGTAAGLSEAERRELLRPHAVNAAVLHARVFGPEPLAPETVIAAFVDGARVRAEALGALADIVGGERLGGHVRLLLVEHPPPARTHGEDVVPALRATYAAQEHAAILIAAALDRG